MNDQVLTDEEKNALLDGVESGAVEVLSGTGTAYASVTPFEVAPRNRLVSNSYPRLRGMDRQLAANISKSLALLLNDAVEVDAGPVATCTWGEFREEAEKSALIVEFGAQPLDGSAFIVVPAGVVRNVVETFYGGSKENPPVRDIEGFTPGEINVVSLFCGDILHGIRAVWRPLIGIDARQLGVHQGMDVVDAVDHGAAVLHTRFALSLGDDRQPFSIVWPASTLAGLLPALEGARLERDAADDARWETVIRKRLAAATVDISSRIGHAKMRLREIATLAPGQVIEFADPQSGTVFAEDVPVLEGRFGVHDGRFAIEARRWVTRTAANYPAVTPLKAAEGTH